MVGEIFCIKLKVKDYTSNDFFNDLNWDENKFDLTCTLKNSLSKFTIEFDYNTDLYTFEKINGLLDHYMNLIDNINQNIDKKIEDITILSHFEEEMILEMSGVNEDMKNESILTKLKRQIRKNPTKTILSDDKTSLNYTDFNLKSNSLANYLKDNFDVKEQDNVLLIANPSIESVLSFYSILKLNAVYVPVNPLAPEKRIRHIIDEVDAKVVLTNIDLDINDVDIVNLTQKSLYDYDNGELEASCQDKLCILHTSGTTGVPKGVQITHDNLENFLISAKNHFYDEKCKIFYHTTNIGFDTSLFEIIFSILNGIQLHVIDENYDFTRIPENILIQKSVINIVPAKLKMFLTLPNFDNVMENVGQLILAGEALNKKLVSEIHENYNPVIYNAYGPCEATIFASIKKVISSDKITIGKANINTHIYILNDEKQLCPIGVPGELCIGGKHVSDGYLNKSDETNKHFIANPFAEDILYCSGDLAYLDSEGEINFIGRKDSQIKINGQRIEIDEINKQIEKNKDIVEAITVPNSQKTLLYSYIIGDSVIDTDRLLNDLAEVLLPFMVPVSIMQIDSMPLNNNGKIDTKKLPKPETINHEYKAPTNDIEKAIVNIWENILDANRVGINDDFYRLGGDSIKAIRIVSLLQNEGIICNPGDILRYKTPYLIAKNVGDKDNVSYESAEGIFDLLPIQYYFFDQINRNDYTQEFILESAIDLDIHILQTALDELTNLHDMLRVKFHVENGKHIQEILPLDTRICEINEIGINDNPDNNIADIIKNSSDSIDIFNKLIDVSLVRYEDKCYLIFVIHHLIIDGVSWSILLDDLTYIYNQLTLDNGINFNGPHSYESGIENIKTSANTVLNYKTPYMIAKNIGDMKEIPCNIIEDNDFATDNVYHNPKIDNGIRLTRPYPYKNWVEDVKLLVENITEDERQHGIEVNEQLDDLEIKGTADRFDFKVNVEFSADNLLMLSEEEYWAFAIARAYKRTYGTDIIFNRESYGRDESMANLYRTIGWFTSQYPVCINIADSNDDLSFIRSVYELKTAFKSINNLGLNYSSLIYTANEFEYKHCPVTFNFLSNEFTFENNMFKSDNHDFSKYEKLCGEVYGVDFNISREDDAYYVSGNYPKGTYIGDKFCEFVENIKSELKFIGCYTFEDNLIACRLSDSQMEIYFNEKAHDMGTAYSTIETVECRSDKSIDEIKKAINTFINKHPVLKGRIDDDGDTALLICDSYPLIEVKDTCDYSSLIKPFDLNRYLARFFIIDSKDLKIVVYDIHHIINDAVGFNIIESDLIAALEGNLDSSIDLGFLYASRDSFESKFHPIYETAQCRQVDF